MANISEVFATLGNKIKLEAKRHGPQAMIIGGGIGTVVAIVVACIETKKALEIIDDSKKNISDIRESEITDGYTEKD